jgi:hypothetical protein
MIDRLIKVLEKQGYEYAASLLSQGRIDVEVSSNYTSGGLFCCAATLVVYLPLLPFSKITGDSHLSDKVDRQLIKCAQLVEPPKDYGTHIQSVRYEYDDSLDLDVAVETANANILSEEYLDSQLKKCKEKTANGDFDGVITNARTLIESVLIKILEEEGGSIDYDGNLVKLFKAVAKKINLDPAVHDSDSIKQILSGFASVINGMSNYRNEYGDAHGRSATKAVKLRKRHALLAMNSALTICDYLISFVEEKKC